MLKNKCIVRGNNSGVFYGTVDKIEGPTVTMSNVRRLYYWEGANTISQIAEEGVKFPDKCKFTMSVKDMVILDGIEISKCRKEAITNLDGVPVWKL